MTARKFFKYLKNSHFQSERRANRDESAISAGSHCHRPVIECGTKKAGVKHASLMSGK